MAEDIVSILLAIINVLSVFPEIMLFQQLPLPRFLCPVYQQILPRYLRQLLQYDRIVHGVGRARSPDEGAMAVDKHRRNIIGIFVLERLHDDSARLHLIASFYLGSGHLPGAGYLAEEIVRVGRSERRYSNAALGEGRRPAAVRMQDAADRRYAKDRVISFRKANYP